MADFNGFKCDTCGDVLPNDERIKAQMVYRGAVNMKGKARDLCARCAGIETEAMAMEPPPKPKAAKAATKKGSAPQNSEPPLSL